jgi:hypothetical protein
MADEAAEDGAKRSRDGADERTNELPRECHLFVPGQLTQTVDLFVVDKEPSTSARRQGEGGEPMAHAIDHGALTGWTVPPA